MQLLTQTSPTTYQQQFDEKADRLKTQFNTLYTGQWNTYSSQHSYYRARAEFGVWHDNDDLHYAMFEPGSRTPVFIKHFDIANMAINNLMPQLIEAIRPNPMLRQRLFQVEFLSTKAGDMLVTLIYHKRIDDTWLAEAQPLAESLGIKLIGRSRKVKLPTSEDQVKETLTVNGNQFHYFQAEGGFSQPNPEVAEKMIEWALEQTTEIGGDLLELYCGNGNFTIPLSRQFNKVLATEISKTSVNLGLKNFAANNVDNAQIIRMSSEEFTDAMNETRAFRRMKDTDLKSFDFSTIFVDPPRAGLDEGTLALTRSFDHILYISCNPETLHRDLEALSDQYEITKMAFFDQFPYTHHAESGAMLKRR